MKKRRTKRKQFGVFPDKAHTKLHKAMDLLADGEFIEARQMLEELDKRHPNNGEILYELSTAYGWLQESAFYQATAEKLLRIEGLSPFVLYGLANSYMTDGRVALAVRTFRRLSDKFPDWGVGDEVRERLALCESCLREMLDATGLGNDVGFAERQEEVQCLMARNEMARARRLAEELLRERPEFTAVRNNLSIVLAIEGQTGPAIWHAREVLRLAPDNVHAISNLTYFLCLHGEFEEAHAMADKVKSVRADNMDLLTKQVEALSTLGDDAGVRNVWQAAKRDVASEGHSSTMLLHHAAVALSRSGDEKEASRLWQRILELSPGFSLASENLANSSLPVGERDAAWPFNYARWFPQSWCEELIRMVGPSARGADDAGVMNLACDFLGKYPGIAKMIPMLLERGDPQAKEFSLQLIKLAQTSELLQVAFDFALSQAGCDKWRHRAAVIVAEAGLLPNRKARLWAQGEWQELILASFVVNDEPSVRHSPKVSRMLNAGFEALQAQDFMKAEDMFKRASANEPDSPALIQNLAVVYELTGRRDQARELVREINRRHPDYTFAATSLARTAINRGKTQEAEELLRPLLGRKQFHFSEYAAFCEAQILLAIAQKQPDAARQWVKIWEQADPDLDTAYWEMRIGRGTSNRLKQIFGMGK